MGRDVDHKAFVWTIPHARGGLDRSGVGPIQGDQDLIPLKGQTLPGQGGDARAEFGGTRKGGNNNAQDGVHREWLSAVLGVGFGNQGVGMERG